MQWILNSLHTGCGGRTTLHTSYCLHCIQYEAQLVCSEYCILVDINSYNDRINANPLTMLFIHASKYNWQFSSTYNILTPRQQQSMIYPFAIVMSLVYCTVISQSREVNFPLRILNVHIWKRHYIGTHPNYIRKLSSIVNLSKWLKNSFTSLQIIQRAHCITSYLCYCLYSVCSS